MFKLKTAKPLNENEKCFRNYVYSFEAKHINQKQTRTTDWLRSPFCRKD